MHDCTNSHGGCRQHHEDEKEYGRGFFSRRHRHRGGGRRSGKIEEAGRRVLMVGNPNVGKSALFNRLTGSYVVVSNYPGTTVALSQGRMRHSGMDYAVVDTPGMYTVFLLIIVMFAASAAVCWTVVHHSPSTCSRPSLKMVATCSSLME